MCMTTLIFFLLLTVVTAYPKDPTCDLQQYFQGPNIARRRPASQHPGDYNHQNASLAVDGDIGDGGGAKNCSHTGQAIYGDHAWWNVNLQQASYITGIKIYNRADTFHRFRLQYFKVVGITAAKNKTIYQDTGNNKYEDDVLCIKFDDAVQYSSIRIELPPNRRDSFLTLCEVEVFALSCPGIVPVNFYARRLSSQLSPYQLEGRVFNPVGFRIEIRCFQSYEPTTPFAIECLKNRKYSRSEPFCSLQTCTTPNKPEHGNYIRINESRIKVVCDVGYELQSGNEIRTCLQGVSWSGSSPICSRVTCIIPAIEHGAFRPTSFTSFIGFSYYHDELTIVCDTGFIAVSDKISCNASGEWSIKTNFCRIKTCQFPRSFDNGHYENSSGKTLVALLVSVLNYNSSLHVACNHGYIGSVEKITCQLDGTWSSYPSCSKISCTIIQSKNVIYTKGGKEVNVISFDESVIPVCLNSSFRLSEMKGPQTCMANGLLSGDSPKCISLCEAPTQLLNGSYVDRDGTRLIRVHEGQRLYIKCDQGFEASKETSDNICLADFSWSGQLPLCKAIQCDTGQLEPNRTFLAITDVQQTIPFNQTLTLQCLQGYDFVGEKQETRCNYDKRFDLDETSFNCIKVIDKAPGSTPVALIGGIGASSGAVIVAVVVIAVVIIFRKRRSIREQKTKLPAERRMTDIQNDDKREVESDYSYVNETEIGAFQTNGNIYNTVESDQYGDVADYYSFDVEKLPKSAIRVEELSQMTITSDSQDEKLQSQFKSFVKGMTATHNAAVKTENRTKNKYREMYPYDQNRVVLQSGNLKSETDYINASYINGFSEPKRYIAAQAPLTQQKTVNDFWRMVWQQNVSKIVMLTKLREEDKVKCDQYWPDKDAEMFGRIQVTLQKTEQYSEFVIRHLLVSKDKCSARKVVQFHFTAWPDKGVPKYASSLVHFRQKAMKEQTDMKGPVIVHCSAGVGRTGTFIALDILTEQGTRLGYVDVYGCVQNLRKQRVLMVQTQDQYVFIHVALTEALMLSPSVLPASQFIQSYTEALRLDSITRKRPIDTQFEMLQKLSPSTDESQYISAKEVQNRKKNRYANILPVDEYMPRLSDGRDYINAVFLPSYKTKNAFIITQSPLESTKKEFWRLVSEHRVHTIVMMNSVSELKSEEEIYWPQTDTPVQLDDLTITLLDEEEEVGHNVMTLEMGFKEKVRKIKLLQYCHQMKDDFPGNPESILTLMELVQYWQQQTGNNPVLVHCMNGADKSGLFCVISAVIERLKIEQDVAISQTIEIMRNSREQIIISPEQFKFCHDVVLAYIKQFETYSNFAEVHA